MFTYFYVYFSVFITTVTNARTAEKSFCSIFKSIIVYHLY